MPPEIPPEIPPELAMIDVASMRGLELGPLASPKVHKDQGDITYLDHASTEELKRKYATNSLLADQIDALVDVDVVCRPDETLAEAVAASGPFDYVIAAHVFEHIPDLVDSLSQANDVLVAGGILSLVLPDKRYTFDVNRRTTDIAEVVDAHLRRITSPTFAQLYDFFAKTVTIDGMVDAVGIWAGTVDYAGVVRDDVPDSDVAAFEFCLAQRETPRFVDVHCHVFTPTSFLDIFEKLVKLDLVDFEIGAFFDTRADTFEFHVSLRKVAVGQDERKQLHAAQLASVREARRAITSHRPGIPDPPDSAEWAAPTDSGAPFAVSGLERRMLVLKRRLVHRIRHREPLATAEARDSLAIDARLGNRPD